MASIALDRQVMLNKIWLAATIWHTVSRRRPSQTQGPAAGASSWMGGVNVSVPHPMTRVERARSCSNPRGSRGHSSRTPRRVGARSRGVLYVRYRSPGPTWSQETTAPRSRIWFVSVRITCRRFGASSGIIGLLDVCESDFLGASIRMTIEEQNATYGYDAQSIEKEIIGATKDQETKYEAEELFGLDEGVAGRAVEIAGLKEVKPVRSRRDSSDLLALDVQLPDEPCESRSESDLPQRGRDYNHVLTDMKCPIDHADRLFRFPESSRATDWADNHFPVEVCYSACLHIESCQHFSYGTVDAGNVCISCRSLQQAEDQLGFEVYDMISRPSAVLPPEHEIVAFIALGSYLNLVGRDVHETRSALQQDTEIVRAVMFDYVTPFRPRRAYIARLREE